MKTILAICLLSVAAIADEPTPPNVVEDLRVAVDELEADIASAVLRFRERVLPMPDPDPVPPEIHDFTGLPMTADGWTDFTAMYQHPDHYLDSRIVYVSSSEGNDGTAVNYTPASPEVGGDPFAVTGGVMAYATVAAAYNQLRHGFPDIMLLNRGDVWSAGLGQWKKSGRSAIERMLVASYGQSSSRPRIGSSTSSTLFAHTGGGSPPSVDFLIFSDFEVYVAHKDPGSPSFDPSNNNGNMSWNLPSRHRLYENIKCTYTQANFQGNAEHVAIRRCVMERSYSVTSHSQGMFANNQHGLLIEECVVDHGGWHEDVAGANPTIYNHNVYIQNNCSDVVFRNNISARASSHGVQLRPGGVMSGNLFLSNPINAQIGGGVKSNAGGVIVDVNNNVVLGSADINRTNTDPLSGNNGWGMMFYNIAGGVVHRNILAHQSSKSSINNFSFDLSSAKSGGNSDPVVGLNNLQLSENVIWDWRGPVKIIGSASPSGFEEGKIHNIEFRGNFFGEPGENVLMRIGIDSAAQIASSNNLFFSGASLDAWFRHGSTDTSMTDYKVLVSDDTSTVWEPSETPVPTLEDYMVLCGVDGGEEEFIFFSLQQSRFDWDSRFTAKSVGAFMQTGVGF